MVLPFHGIKFMLRAPEILPTHAYTSLFTFVLFDFQPTGEKGNSLVFILHFFLRGWEGQRERERQRILSRIHA